MKTYKRLARSSSWLALALSFGASVIVPAVFSPAVTLAASTMPTNRSVLQGSDQIYTASPVDANGNAFAAGAGGNGKQTYYKISFNLTEADHTNMGAMAFMFCTTPFAGTTCTNPGTTTFMDVSSVASVVAQTGFTGGTWALDTSTTANTNYFGGNNACSGTGTLRKNCILVTRTAAADATAGTNVSITFGTTGGWIQNPDTAGTYYVRISTFNATDTFTTAANNDEGAAAFAIISGTIDITSKVQEQLTFSIGTAAVDPSTTCAALGGPGNLDVGDTNGALSILTPYDKHSYWRVYTNANNGTAIEYSGDTLKTPTGYSITPAVSTAEAIANGAEKFGIGLDSGDNGTGAYSLSTLDKSIGASNNTYTQGSGGINAAKVALDTSSVTTPVIMVYQTTPQPITCETGSVRYIASMSTTTKPGIYRTSFTYIATPTF